ncbi:MAG: hypothetical protein D084_Lepto4C00516G0001, partial [Leptospirillum sp. Group IV 'UBA BS']
MSRLVNSCSYSHSRGDLFRMCPRRYWFVRYGSWGGWERDADPETREIYRLNKLSNRYLWTGHHVHETVRHLLEPLRVDGALPPVERLREELLALLRREFAASRKDRSGTNPVRKGFFGLLEHEGGPFAIDEADWKPTVDRALAALEGFWKSWVVPEVAGLPSDHLLDRDEELRTAPLEVDGRLVPVHLKIDLAFKSRQGEVLVLDWKTGRPGKAGDHDRQLGLYAWYFEQERGIPVETLRMGPVYLAFRPERRETEPVPRERVVSVLEETTATIRIFCSLIDDPKTGG